MLQQWATSFKNNKKDMNTEKLISLKENFTGQKFQWIKTDRPELLGKVVRCKDVDPASDGRFYIIFDDGSRVESSKLNSNLLMIHGDMQPLSKDEVTSIYGNRVRPVAPSTPSQTPPIQTTKSSFTYSTQSPSEPVTNKSNMFSMFNSEETQMSLTLNVKMPDKKLLRLMYSSAENKDKFLSELAEHLHSIIDRQIIKESIQTILAPSQIKKEAKPIINLKEVDESK